MKISKKQIRTLVREAVRVQLDEIYGISQYERMLELKHQYEDDIKVLDKIGPELYQKIIDFREQASDFNEFKRLVRGMPVHMAKKFWDRQMGKVSTERLVELRDEWEELKDRFKEIDATTEADRAYGRKRTKIIDTETGEVIGTETDKRGSLGS